LEHRESRRNAGSKEKSRDEQGFSTEKARSVVRIAEPTRTIVVVPEVADHHARTADAQEGGAVRSAEARLDEAVGLARAIELEVLRAIPVRIASPKPATLMGSGKVEDIRVAVEIEDAELVIVDHALTPVQQRNLEKAWNAKVLDRTGLILEIFGARARTREGRLQVELAHLNYQKSRLVRSWTHLERQRGGFGFLGGPGETQIEADRRLLQERIAKLEDDLDAVKRTRDLHRKGRRKVPHPVVALVGYTNAGKSTLFNQMTTSEVMAKDLLFATLDPTLRRLKLPHGTEAILSDTVGFISDLPTHLVAAFRATLEEVIEAEVILHVRDIAHADSAAQAADVAEVLGLLGIAKGEGARIIEVWNKIDLVDEARREALLEQPEGPGGELRVPVSAVTGEGVPALLDAIETRLVGDRPVFDLVLQPEEGAKLAWLYGHGEVLNREDRGEAGVALRVRLPAKHLDAFNEAYRGKRVEAARG
jgi:GTP-binding protein HflX